MGAEKLSDWNTAAASRTGTAPGTAGLVAGVLLPHLFLVTFLVLLCALFIISLSFFTPPPFLSLFLSRSFHCFSLWLSPL